MPWRAITSGVEQTPRVQCAPQPPARRPIPPDCRYLHPIQDGFAHRLPLPQCSRPALSVLHPLADLDINSPIDGDTFPIIHWNDNRLYERVEDQMVQDYIHTLYGYFNQRTRDKVQQSWLIHIYTTKLEKCLDKLNLLCTILS